MYVYLCISDIVCGVLGGINRSGMHSYLSC